ncbi:related to MSS1-mitochondrial GTPase involved in expression of COX1 [Sporisorium reilianum f. sp. reilianum]|uniref:Related to MSS1-mitochondrial GTPase involved in expression of COX1 n=1 Tax=Sporisorium reilianum f. sp. reilianum TaxID=72559 RepID=A0A2N8U9S3_9BASI|nr:related to MSS1-mitochondrial GTPase involved in expression of COX1 [Sporisorium reilianum f. sp. reilianum]
MPPRCPPRGSWLSLSTTTAAAAAAAVPQRSVQVAPFLLPRLHDFRPSSRPPSNPVHTASSSRRPPTLAPRHTRNLTTPSSTDTIFALATGAARAGVAIIRISGPQVPHIYTRICLTSRQTPYTRLPPPHKLVLRNIHHPRTGELLDARAGVIVFPQHRSYTGEEALELHVHGGVATVSAVLDALAEMGKGVRMAEAREFTRRAFERGRVDLAKAEAVHGLVVAETAVQRRVALQGVGGAQTRRYDEMRATLVDAMAMVEALIDFADEDGVEEGTWAAATHSVNDLATLLRSELGLSTPNAQDGHKEPRKAVRHVGEILTTGIRLALYGPPNAGKSSLLNTLADRAAAIVSATPGTTRDVLQVHLDLAGYKVVVYDTAGIRDAPAATSGALDDIERIGIERARHVVAAADLALLVLPATETVEAQTVLRPHSYGASDPDLVFYNKSDLLPSSAPPVASSATQRSWRGSVRTNAGLPELIGDLAGLISRKYALDTAEPALITHSRHRALLLQCLAHIDAFQLLAAQEDVDLVLAAEHLRYAAKQVGRVTGRDVSADEILGSVFATFCIGK